MAEVPLGHLHVHARASEFELILASSIKITASEEDEVDDLTQRLTTDELNERSSPRPYLYCADSFSFVILLQFDADLIPDEHHILIETFSTQIQTAMMWQQLHFSQPSLRTEVAADGTVRMELTLKRTERTSKIGSTTPHKLGVDVPFYHTRPPSGVPNAALDSVLLTAVIRSRPSSTSDSRLRHGVFDEQDDRSSFSADGTDPRGDGSKAISALCDCTNDNEIADEMLFAVEPEYEAIADLEDHTPIRPHEARDSRVGSLLILLDASVRRSISASSASSRHVSIEVDRSFQPMSTVAPAVFRADHLPAVASRALFLRTISHSVGAVASRCRSTKTLENCNHDCLPFNMKASSSMDQQKSTANECSSSIGHERNAQVLNKLWSTLDKTLLDLMPEQRLKPLSESNSGTHGFDIDTRLSHGLEEADRQFTSEAGSNSDFEDIALDERWFQEEEDEAFENELDLLHDIEVDEHNDGEGFYCARNDAEDITFLIRSDRQSSMPWTKENNLGFDPNPSSDLESGQEEMLYT